MNKSQQRRFSNYRLLSTKLASFNDQGLAELIQAASGLGTSIGGSSFMLKIDNLPIFIKKIKLSSLESTPENFKSTKNIFQLPLYYQYGVGSAGFGAWRELAAHRTTTNWVLAGECLNFPLLFHYRILPSAKHTPTDDELIKIESDVKYWNNSPAIRSRLLARLKATTDIVLFLEYFPSNLYDWYGNQLKHGDFVTSSSMIGDELVKTITYMKAHGLFHMDAHFWNILTDGDHIYFSDFGLALSSSFELSEPEISFFNKHHNYDYYSGVTNFLHCIITSLFGHEAWISRLKECIQAKTKLPSILQSIVERYAPVALIMDDFYNKLRFESKEVPIPIDKLNALNLF